MLNSKLFDKLDTLQAKLQSSINFFQFEYYRKISKKISDPSTSPKCYLTLLKTLLNDRKAPCIPRLFHDSNFITSHFISQIYQFSNLSLYDSSVEDIKALSANLNPFVNLLIFKSCLLQGIFPSEWKKSKCRTNSQKNDKQCVKNYISISFLPICSKVLERIIYKTMFTYFIEINLIFENQSGFKPGDFLCQSSI